MSDLIRSQFEKRFPVPGGVVWRDAAYHLENEKKCTMMSHLFYLGRWEAWQASRESLAVELPVRSCEAAVSGMNYHKGWNDCLD